MSVECWLFKLHVLDELLVEAVPKYQDVWKLIHHSLLIKIVWNVQLILFCKMQLMVHAYAKMALESDSFVRMKMDVLRWHW